MGYQLLLAQRFIHVWLSLESEIIDVLSIVSRPNMESESQSKKFINRDAEIQAKGWITLELKANGKATMLLLAMRLRVSPIEPVLFDEDTQRG
jgi:hypothetical protein